MKRLSLCFPVLCLTTFAIFLSNAAVIAAEPVVVGVVHREDFAYAKMMKHAFEMALEKINAAGGIKGSPLKLAYGDDQGDPAAGELAVKKLIQTEKAVMLVGGYSSSNTLKMAYTANKMEKPFLVCTAADDRITQYDLEYIYRLNPPAWEYTKGLEAFLLEEVKPASISIVYENSPYGTSGAMRMMWFCRANEIEIKGIHPYFKNRAAPEYLAKVLAPIKNNEPEVIFMVSYLEDATLLVKKFRDMGVKALLCGGAGGFTHEKFQQQTDDASESLVTATLWSPSTKFPMAANFHKAFVERYSITPDYHGAEAYSALMVCADALKRAKSMAPEDIRAALSETQLETPFGQIEFTAYGQFKQQNTSETQVFQIKSGRFETIWPLALATETYTPPEQ